MNWKVHDDPEIVVRPATYDDALQMGERLRESDRREVAALTDEPPAQALVSSYLASAGRCYTVTMDGALVLMVGCAVNPVDPREGIPWLLGTDLMYQRPFPRVMLEHGPRVLSALTEGLTFLINLTADPDHHAWLQGLGFDLLPNAEPGRNGEPLWVFTKGITHVRPHRDGSALAGGRCGGHDAELRAAERGDRRAERAGAPEPADGP